MMWSREELKQRAKNVLRKYYWIAFLVTLVAGILGGSAGAPGLRFNYGFNRWDFNNFSNGFPGEDFFRNNDFFNGHYFNFNNPDFIGTLGGLLFGTMFISSIFIVGMAFAYAFRIFLGGPIETGMKKYFMEARQDKSDFVNVFYSFRRARYLNVVKAIAWRELFTFLWSLLFIVPGIIKGFSYSMIPYIMADNPMMDYKRAMKLSMAMTDGHKGDMFVLWLSFSGWYILGILACGIGVWFLKPYWYATAAELYAVLSQNAIDKGLCTADEVGQPLPAPVV